MFNLAIWMFWYESSSEWNTFSIRISYPITSDGAFEEHMWHGDNLMSSLLQVAYSFLMNVSSTEMYRDLFYSFQIMT